MYNRKFAGFLTNFILVILSMLLIYPTVLAFFSSFKSLSDLLGKPVALLPGQFTLDAWKGLFAATPAFRWLGNGLLISVLGMVLNVVVCVPAAYVFARSTSKFVKFFFNLVVATVMLPLAAYLVPLYTVVAKLGLLNTYLSVALPISESVFGIFFLTQSFKNVPAYYEEAAIVDGCTQIQGFLRIFLPIVKNSLITIAIFTFIWKWNSFLWPLMVLNDANKFPLTLGIATAVGNDISWMNSLMAGAIFTIMPIVIMFIMFQRYISGSNVLSGSK
ncbi:alpha-1,4-digalacturonate transport system permease protein/putative chitobiose transport system permease protein [Hydrogenispora ethanolica]|jgi:ABC-type glycerol-3-phosphate transport system permease component|uniref:Alpha-1,4-digalacturonate transport system permease protein/putative chitobiose transport system permease protein n=1 Tax=Hydrogenispora ethanolica TaxID=1082276 RepID=A0A4R1RC59_HYDET|nr:carbohydrate ABC transporter permease [Hydrogenispora ethanolica]TCL63329.1 alpha-1,4-digalacturonate transport system permease protein/putative chitobiose transport system permease protein [Hydrogenispora ethanolica]